MPRLLHPVYRRVSLTGRAGLRNSHPQRSCIGRGQISFLGSDLHDCSIRFSKFIITDRVPLRRSHVEPYCLYRELRQFVHGLQKSTTIKEDTYVLNYQIMSYILNILICVGMI
jgi:hypothetical protein